MAGCSPPRADCGDRSSCVIEFKQCVDVGNGMYDMSGENALRYPWIGKSEREAARFELVAGRRGKKIRNCGILYIPEKTDSYINQEVHAMGAAVLTQKGPDSEDPWDEAALAQFLQRMELVIRAEGWLTRKWWEMFGRPTDLPEEAQPSSPTEEPSGAP